MYTFDAEDGKYTFINNNGIVTIQRYGEDWRNESGDKALLSLLHEVEEMEKYINFLENRDFDTTCTPAPKKTINLKGKEPMGDMHIPQRFGFHDWYKDKKGREFPHGYSQIHRILSGQTDASQEVIENTKALFEEYETEFPSMRSTRH